MHLRYRVICLTTDFLWITAFISQALAYTRKTALILLRSVVDRWTEKVLSSGKKTTPKLYLFSNLSVQWSMFYAIPRSHAVESHQWIMVTLAEGMEITLQHPLSSWPRGAFLTREFLGVIPWIDIPKPAAANFPFLLSFPHWEDAAAATPFAVRSSSPQYLLNSSERWWWRAHPSPWTPETVRLGKGFVRAWPSQP